MALTVGTLWASGWLVHRIGWPLRVRSPVICIRSSGLRRLRGTGRISPGRAERSGVESPRRVEWL